MNETVSTLVDTSCNQGMVLLSFVIAVMGSIVALTVATRVRNADGKIHTTNVLSTGVALGGIGVWARLFTGMYAAEFVCTTTDRGAFPEGFGYVASFTMATIVVVGSALAVVLISIDQRFQAMHRPATAMWA